MNVSGDDEEKESKVRTTSQSGENRNSEKVRLTTANGYLDDFVVDKRTISKNHQSSALAYIGDDLQSQSSSIDRDDFNLLRRSSRNN